MLLAEAVIKWLYAINTGPNDKQHFRRNRREGVTLTCCWGKPLVHHVTRLCGEQHGTGLTEEKQTKSQVGAL